MAKSQEGDSQTYKSCTECSGTGKKTEIRMEETTQIDCPRCGGTGRVKIPIKTKPPRRSN